MTAFLSSRWGLISLRGLAALLFGGLTLAWPELSLGTLLIFFGAYAFVDGVLALFTGLSTGLGRTRGWLILLTGVAGIGAALFTFRFPSVTSLDLLTLIAVWAVITGLLEVVEAIPMGGVGQQITLAVRGILTTFFGVFLFVFPGEGALAVAPFIGIYALIAGMLALVHALRLRTTVSGSTG